MARSASTKVSMVNPASFGITRVEPLLLQRPSERRGDLNSFLIVDLGEQIDVLGFASNEAVDDHRATTGEREGASFREAQGGAGDPFLQGVQRHGVTLPASPSRSVDATPRAPTPAVRAWRAIRRRAVNA